MPEAWRKRKEGERGGRRTHTGLSPSFPVLCGFLYYSCKCRGCSAECLRCTGSSRQAPNDPQLIRHCSFTALLLTRSIYSLCLNYDDEYHYQLPACCTTCVITPSSVYPALNDYRISQMFDAWSANHIFSPCWSSARSLECLLRHDVGCVEMCYLTRRDIPET